MNDRLLALSLEILSDIAESIGGQSVFFHTSHDPQLYINEVQRLATQLALPIRIKAEPKAPLVFDGLVAYPIEFRWEER